jgi:competence protein ComEA
MRNFIFTLAVVFLLVPCSAYAAVVNINTANATQLDALPGIGPSKAAAIVSYRTAHGLFAQIEDIKKVKGIGPSTYDGLKDSITVGGSPAGATIAVEKTVVQPPTPTTSSHTKQTVSAPTQSRGADQNIGSADITSVSESAHAKEGTRAPSTTNKIAAHGAAPSPQLYAPLGEGILHSVWTLGFLGVVLLAGGMLMIL